MIDTTRVLENLNPAQAEAVLQTEGPLLILAGAGSGKTRVITHRVAHLVASGKAEPQEIIAVTFTNKAAGEMKDRIARLLGSEGAGSRIGTFHALCLRILRREAARAGLPPGFQIFDTADQLAVVKSILKDFGIDETQHPPRGILARISHAKNRMQTPEDLAARALAPDSKTFVRCFEEYQIRLRKLGGLDFDDLLGETLRLFDSDEQVAARYARGCRYLLVDEYQDTNHCQYRLTRHLARAHRNICVVGDEDQSVYSWRGADIQNILDFEHDYPDAKTIKLEQNYRSTKTILAAAGGVIRQNTRRHDKTLWTENEPGALVHYHRARDDRDESEVVVQCIRSLEETLPSGEIGVLYRTNNQSRLIEEALVRAGISYRIVGSVRFYERKEIKDLLAYLRLLVAPQEDGSFLRAVNTPARGIGKTTLEQIDLVASENGIPLYHAAALAVEQQGQLMPRAAAALRGFFETMARLREIAGISFLPREEHVDEADGSASRERSETSTAALRGAGESSAAPAAGRSPFGAGSATSADPRSGLEMPSAQRDLFGGSQAQRGDGEELRKADAKTTEASAGFDAKAGGAEAEGAEPEAPPGSHPPIVPIVSALLEATRFRDHLEKTHPGDFEDRTENIDALVSAAAEYDEQVPGGGLQGFLDRSSLRSDTDDVKGDRGITLLTVHSAKGLEFGGVILTGLEENMFPHIRSSDSLDELEEERRLCYVAMTRAKSRLILTNAVQRRSFGDFVENPPSRFLDEIPKELLTMSESRPWTPFGEEAPRLGLSAPRRGYGGGPSASSASRGWNGRPEPRFGRGRPTVAARIVAASGAYEPGGDDYAVGRIVTHPMFGRGMILHKEGAGDSLKLTIRFQNTGTKKIIPRHTTLVVHD